MIVALALQEHEARELFEYLLRQAESYVGIGIRDRAKHNGWRDEWLTRQTTVASTYSLRIATVMTAAEQGAGDFNKLAGEQAFRDFYGLSDEEGHF